MCVCLCFYSVTTHLPYDNVQILRSTMKRNKTKSNQIRPNRYEYDTKPHPNQLTNKLRTLPQSKYVIRCTFCCSFELYVCESGNLNAALIFIELVFRFVDGFFSFTVLTLIARYDLNPFVSLFGFPNKIFLAETIDNKQF